MRNKLLPATILATLLFGCSEASENQENQNNGIDPIVFTGPELK